MGFLEVAKARYSVRAYEKRAVEQEKVDAVLEAGGLRRARATGIPRA